MAKKKKLTKEEKVLLKRKESFQEHLPIDDIRDGLFIAKDGAMYPMYKVGGKSLDLMGIDEKLFFVRQEDTYITTMPIEGYQLLQLPIPFDIEPYLVNQMDYIETLQYKINDLENQYELTIDEQEKEELEKLIVQQSILLEYIVNRNEFVRETIESEIIVNKECYFIPKIRDRWNLLSVQEAAKDIEHKLKLISESSYRCNENEMRDALYILLNPIKGYNYKTSAAQFIPTLE